MQSHNVSINEEERIRKERNPHGHPYRYGRQLVNKALVTWRKDQPRCVICGEYGETTREHAPPQTIYSERPDDFIIVPACLKCQKSEDEGFRDFLAYACARKPTESSLELLKQVSVKHSEKNRSKAYIELVREKSAVKNLMEYDYVSKREEPKTAVKWPKELHDPIILKIAHACHWVFNEGELLTDEKGKLIVVPNYDPNTASGSQVTSNSHPSINVGRDQFIVTHIRGFQSPPFNTSVSMGFHFHSDNDIRKGYNSQVFFMLDKYNGISPKVSEIVQNILAKAPSDSIYDLATPLYEHYPY
jgi:hypothetical protein